MGKEIGKVLWIEFRKIWAVSKAEQCNLLLMFIGQKFKQEPIVIDGISEI